MLLKRYTGDYRSGEVHVEVVPRRYSPGDYAVIWCHEHGASGATWPAVGDGQAMWSVVNLGGFLGASADLGPGNLGKNNWGGPDAMAAVTALWQKLVSRYKCNDEKFIIMGGSQGGLTVLNYVQHHGENLAAALPIIAAVDLLHHYADDPADPYPTDDPGNLYVDIIDAAPELRAAYGGSEASFMAALPEWSPIEYAADFNPHGVPVQFWASDNDNWVISARQHEFCDLAGIQFHSMGNANHGFGGNPSPFAPTWARWMRKAALNRSAPLQANTPIQSASAVDKRGIVR